MRVLAISAVAIATLVFSGAAFASQASLAAVSTLAGDRAGYLEVRLPNDVAVDTNLVEADNRSVEVSGGGVVAGAIFRDATNPNGPVLTITRFDRSAFCSGTCATHDLVRVIGTNVKRSGTNIIVPAGAYRLYLVTDGRAASVTLRLPELGGARTMLAPERSVSVVAKALDRRDPAGLKNVAVFGAESQLTTDGILLDAAELVVDTAHVSTGQVMCFYDSRPASPLAYFPGCPGGETGSILTNNVVRPGPSIARFDGVWYGLTPGIAGMGGSITSASTAASVNWVAAWVELESKDKAPTRAPAPPAITPPAPSPATTTAVLPASEVAAAPSKKATRRATKKRKQSGCSRKTRRVKGRRASCRRRATAKTKARRSKAAERRTAERR